MILTFLFWAFLLFLTVQALLSFYVAARYGMDMVGSHLHFCLTWDWTVRIIKFLAILATILGFMYIMILGDGRFFFWDYVKVFFGAVWNLVATIVTGFFQVMF